MSRAWLAVVLVAIACAPKDRIRAGALARALEEHPEDYVVVDVRSDKEWRGRKGHIPGAAHLAYPGIKERAAEISAEEGQTVVLVCFTGHRSRWSMKAVREAVAGPVIDLRGGMMAWWQGDHPVEIEDQRGAGGIE